MPDDATTPQVDLRCPHCGHDVNIVPTRRCPECGQLFDRGELLRHAEAPAWPWWRLAPLVISLPVAMAAWMVLTIYMLGWRQSSSFLLPGAGLAAFLSIVNSAMIARPIAKQLQRRGHGKDMSLQSRANMVFAGSIALQIMIVAAAAFVVRVIWR